MIIGKIIFFILLLIQVPLFSIEVQLVSNDTDCLENKKIVVKLVFDSNDKAIYKKTLQFSLDNPNLTILQVKYSLDPVTEYIPHLKRTELVIKKTCYVDLLLSEYDSAVVCDLKKRPLNILITYILLTGSGINVAKAVKLSLFWTGGDAQASFFVKKTTTALDKELGNFIAQEEFRIDDNSIVYYLEFICSKMQKIIKYIVIVLQHYWYIIFLIFFLFLFIGGAFFIYFKNTAIARIIKKIFPIYGFFIGMIIIFFMRMQISPVLFFLSNFYISMIAFFYCLMRGKSLPRIVSYGCLLFACLFLFMALPFLVHALLYIYW